jgi:Arc/MetJ family transcription regulator
MLQVIQYGDKSVLMRITIDIEEDVLADVMRITGEKNKSPALAKAVVDFVRRRKAREFGRLIREGAFDYPAEAGNEELTDPVPPLLED